MAHHYLITGATGFIGGHVAAACKERGDSVSTIARPQSDTAALEQLGATIHRGDIADPATISRALEGVDVVVHCAAKVGDRGPVEDYRAINVEALRTLLETCKNRPLHRFVHISTLGVYEARHHHGTSESEPLPATHLDGYTQTKIEAEHLALLYHGLHHVPVVVLRPGFVYGARDRVVLPKLIKRISEGRFHYLGGDQRILNCIYVGNLVQAVFLAVDSPQAIGQVYNLTDAERVTKQRFVNAVTDSLGLARPAQRLPRWLANLASRALQWQIRRAARRGKKPLLTYGQYKFVMLNLDFDISKARRELAYTPRYSFDEAMQHTMAWYRENA